MGKTNKKVPLNWDVIDKMLMAGSGAPTIAKSLHVSDQMLYRRCKEEKGVEFVEYRAKMMERGTDMLIHKGYSMAINGEKTMLIFYLKNRAGFTDKNEVTVALTPDLVESMKRVLDTE